MPPRATPPARSPVLRASAARCSRDWPLGAKRQQCRGRARAHLKRREQAAEAVRTARPRVDELTRSRDRARAQASDLGLQISEANDELDRVRATIPRQPAKLADAKVR